MFESPWLGRGHIVSRPLRLPPGLWLEIRVEPFAAAEPPSWSPQPNATGPALIELREGALVLSNLVLRHEETSRLEHLIHVEDGHLVLSRCQFIAQGSSADFPGDLIAFTVGVYPDLIQTTRAGHYSRLPWIAQFAALMNRC